MIYIISLLVPVSIMMTGYFVLKAVQLGLRWQIQISKQEAPTIEIKNPVKEYVEKKQVEQRTEEQINILEEWLNGAEESR